jgi:hypothetical protein
MGMRPYFSAIFSCNSVKLRQVLETPISIQICSMSFRSPYCPLRYRIQDLSVEGIALSYISLAELYEGVFIPVSRSIARKDFKRFCVVSRYSAQTTKPSGCSVASVAGWEARVDQQSPAF